MTDDDPIDLADLKVGQIVFVEADIDFDEEWTQETAAELDTEAVILEWRGKLYWTPLRDACSSHAANEPKDHADYGVNLFATAMPKKSYFYRSQEAAVKAAVVEQRIFVQQRLSRTDCVQRWLEAREKGCEPAESAQPT